MNETLFVQVVFFNPCSSIFLKTVLVDFSQSFEVYFFVIFFGNFFTSREFNELQGKLIFFSWNGLTEQKLQGFLDFVPNAGKLGRQKKLFDFQLFLKIQL